ncbi:MAG: LysM peptidoglycan-binding domain-containing protein [Elusimicrobia bacterium]|nr:LysM peptidoglycan-binding domain-containing protein [Candidatus Liberimonas magnetica]
MKKKLESLKYIFNRPRRTFIRHSFSFFIFIVVSLITYSLSLTAVVADYDDTGAGARAMGMGNAFTALADDPFCIYYNPAGLGFIRQSQIGADYGKLWVGLDDNSDLSTSFISAVFPFFITESGKLAINKFPKKIRTRKVKKARVFIDDKNKAKEKLLLLLNTNKSPKKDGTLSSVSVSSTAFAAVSSSGIAAPKDSDITKDKTVIRHFGTFAFGWRNFSLTDYYEESSYYLSFGKSYKERLAYGINLKFLSEKYNIDDYLVKSPVFDYGKKDTVSNYSVDAGLIYNILPRFFFGFSASDINQPDLGLKDTDQLQATYRLGFGWRQKSIKWAIDGINNSNKWYTAFGLEKWLSETFALRGGLKMGGNNYVNSGVGFSLNFIGTQIDYAFQIPLVGIKDIGGSHRLSLVCRFGGQPKEELEPGSLELYYANLKDEVSGLKKNLSDVQSEKKKLEEILIEESTLRIRERIKAAESDAKKIRYEERKKTTLQEGSVQRSHIVRKGDTLQSVSREYYGDEKYWNNIYQANKEDIGRGGALTPNQVLIIPSLSQSITTAPPTPGQEPIPENVPVKRVDVDTPIQLIEVKPVPVLIETPKPKELKKESAKSPNNKAENTGPKTHIVKPGENLQNIAQKYYNDPSRWKDIYKANKDKVTGGQVAPGQEITIPQ